MLTMKNNSLLLKQLEDLLHQHISDPDFEITDFCEQLAISRAQLHRIISKETGLSTSLYIRQLRLEQAKKLLTTTDLLVYEVAEKVGFRNVAYFSTSFLETFGFSPKDAKC